MSGAPVKRYSGRLTLYLVITTCAVLAAVIIGRLEPLVAVAPFAAAILSALFTEGAPRARASYEVTQASVHEDEPVDVHIEVRPDADVGVLELVDPLPSWAQVDQRHQPHRAPACTPAMASASTTGCSSTAARASDLGALQHRWHGRPPPLVRWETDRGKPRHVLTVRAARHADPPPGYGPVRTQVYMGKLPGPPPSARDWRSPSLRPHVPGDPAAQHQLACFAAHGHSARPTTMRPERKRRRGCCCLDTYGRRGGRRGRGCSIPRPRNRGQPSPTTFLATRKPGLG